MIRKSKQEKSSAYSCVQADVDQGVITKRSTSVSFSSKQLWLKHQERQDIFLKLAPSVQGIQYPKILHFDHDKVIETYQSGDPLTRKLYDALSPKQQRVLAERVACFLFKVHSIHHLDEKKALKIPFFKSSVYFSKLNLSKRHYTQYNACLKQIRDKNILSEQVLCYRDLKSIHLLYDKKTKLLSVIDFGNVDFDNPLIDFCFNNPLSRNLSVHFLNFVIEEYNRLSGHAIDKSFVYSYLYCAAFYDARQVCKERKLPLCEIEKIGHLLESFLNELTVAFWK